MEIWQLVITGLVSVAVALIPAIFSFISLKAQLNANYENSQKKKEEDKQEILDLLREQNEVEDESLKCLLRTDILRTYFKHCNEEKPQIEQWEKENVNKLYTQYKNLGGNSFIEDVYKTINSWKMVRRDKE